MNFFALHASVFMRIGALERRGRLGAEDECHMHADRSFDRARRIVRVMLDGAPDEAALRERMMQSFRPLTPWLVTLAVRLVADVSGPIEQAEETLIARLLAAGEFRRADARGELPRLVRVRLGSALPASPRLVVPALPAIASPQALAEWLGVTPGRLLWLADPWGQEARRDDGPLRNYRYAWRPREHGPDRLIEMPKRTLRQIQRRLHRELLMRVPVHASAHGFVRARSTLTHARLHAGRDAVLRVDLERFFTGIDAARVRGLFRLLGYPAEVAALLSGLCTNSAPAAVLSAAPHGPLPWADRVLLRHAHLPQGAPSSPALANIAAWRLDVRLSAWAARQGLAYSRYADDLTFSGDGLSHSVLRRRVFAIASIVEDCGFRVNHRKTCCFGSHRAQRVTGLVVNRHPNIAREDFDRLKAILTRCARNGPVGENRDQQPDFRAWLQGRVAWCAGVNPARGAKLERLFARIPWTDAALPPAAGASE